jgi:hypothetical protein
MTLIEIVNWNNIKNIVESCKFTHNKYGNVVIFTNANEWYMSTLVKNLYNSMKLFEPDKKLMIFCSDIEGYNIAKSLDYEFYAYVDIPLLNVSSFNDLNSSQSDDKQTYVKYSKLCFVKTVIMRYILENGYTPLYIDPDMCLLKPSIENLLSYLDNGEIVLSGTPSYINSNIMITMPSFNSINLFQLKDNEVDEIIYSNNINSDEYYIYSRISNIFKMSFICINQNEHLGGNNIYNRNVETYTLHANCISGLYNKINALKKANGWFISDICLLVMDDSIKHEHNKLYKETYLEYCKKYNYDYMVSSKNKIYELYNNYWFNNYNIIIIINSNFIINKSSPPIIPPYLDYFDNKIGVVSLNSLNSSIKHTPYILDINSYNYNLDPSKYYSNYLLNNSNFIPKNILDCNLLIIQPNIHEIFFKNLYLKYTNILLGPNPILDKLQINFLDIIGFELQLRNLYKDIPWEWNSNWNIVKKYVSHKDYDNKISYNDYLNYVYFLHI